MSRIEKALEKAVQIRQSAKEHSLDFPAQTQEHKFVQPVFEAGAAAVDQSLVDKHIVCITDPHSSAAEQYRKLRARVFKATEKNFQNTLMVTSSYSGEGKSITAINIAVSIAQEIDRTVLLIDADLRNPSIHKYLGLKSQFGLSDYLLSQVDLSDILVKTGIGKLVLLPAGKPPRNPAELLSSEKMMGLVREMKHRYRDRYIIFDSSPVLMTADTLTLGNYMDGVIFVVQAGSTAPKAAMQALSLLKGCTVLGTVFNDVPQYLAQSLHPYYYYPYGVQNKIKNSDGTFGGNNGSGSEKG